MTFFDQVYSRLFSNRAYNTNHYVLSRSEKYNVDFLLWKDKRMSSTLFDMNESYYLKKKGVDQHPQVHIFKNNSANGFAVTDSNYFEKNEMQYIADVFVSRIKEQSDYRLANADVIEEVKKDHVLKKEKYYLKPAITTNFPIPQLFGNILIENIFIDGRHNYFKLMATVYHDRNYQNFLPFDKLHKILFQ